MSKKNKKRTGDQELRFELLRMNSCSKESTIRPLLPMWPDVTYKAFKCSGRSRISFGCIEGLSPVRSTLCPGWKGPGSADCPWVVDSRIDLPARTPAPTGRESLKPLGHWIGLSMVDSRESPGIFYRHWGLGPVYLHPPRVRCGNRKVQR